MRNFNFFKKNNRNIILSIVIFIFSLLFTVSAFFFNFSYYVKTLILLSYIMFISIFILNIFYKNKIFNFLKDSKMELTNIVWPGKKETIQTTSIVITIIVFSCFILWCMDSLIIGFIAKIVHLY